MQSRLVSNGTERTFMLVMEAGEEAFESIRNFAVKNHIGAASVSASGAFERVTIAFFELDAQRYRHIDVLQQSEVLSLIGDVTLDEHGKSSPHLHAVLGLSNGQTRGGHFMKGIVRPTLEVLIRETPAKLRRTYRPEFGIALIDTKS